MTPPGAHAFPQSRLLLALGLAMALVACGSKSNTSTGPSPVKCQVSLEAPSGSIEPGGGKGAITVSAQPECSWTASSGAAWLTGLTPASGQGSGRVEFQAAANPAATTRQSFISINDHQVPVQQQAASCRFEVSPLSVGIDGAGGTVTITVSTLAGCGWQASGDAGWVAVGNTSGTGSGSVTLRVAPGVGETRSAALLVAGQRVTVTQSSTAAPSPSPSPSPSPNCVFSLDRTSETAGADGGPVTVGVSGQPACPWTAASGAGWITVVTGASGMGSGAVTFTVAANSGAARTGTLTIASRMFTVVQNGAGPSNCRFSIAPGNQAIGAGGAAGVAVAVSAAAGCAWSARSNDGWIALTSGATGIGDGAVTFDVAGNTASARTGTLTIAGQTFTVTQAASSPSVTCTYSISPTEQSINEKGGQISIAVSTSAGCAWTAASNESWLVVTGGASGRGSGTVAIDVGSTGGKKRNGTVTIAGQTFTVNQSKKADSVDE